VPQKLGEAALARRREEWLSGLHAVQTALTGTADLQAVLQVVADELRKGTGAEVGQVFVCLPRTSELEFAASSGKQLTPSRASHLQPGRSYAALGISRGPIFYSRDLGKGPAIEGRDVLIRLGLTACVAVPMITQQQVVGAMVALTARGLELDQPTVRFLETLAGQAAIALNRSRISASVDEPTSAENLPADRPVAALTPSQRAILQLVIDGKANRQIAEEMHLSENTVKFHMREIFHKLQARNRAQAAIVALRRGIF
jgi:DNA-binding NarL/FixJ family response regulator